MGDFVPRPLIKFQYSSKLLFSQFQIWILRQCGRQHAFEPCFEEVVYLRCFLQIYAPTFFKSWLSAKISFSVWGLRPKDHYTKLYTSFTSYNHCWFVHECEQLSTSLETMLFVSNICFKYAPKWIISSLILQKNSGEEQRAPSPNPFPRFRSGFAIRSVFTLNSWALRTLYSGFALDYRALRSLDSGFTLNFQLAKLVWPPKYISGSASACPLPFGEFLDRLLIINYTDWL